MSKKLTLVIISRKNNTISFSVFSMQFDEKSFYFADIHRDVPMYIWIMAKLSSLSESMLARSHVFRRRRAQKDISHSHVTTGHVAATERTANTFG